MKEFEMIKKKNNGRYVVNLINEYGDRVQKTFLRKQDAVAFESSVAKIKYEKKLNSSNLIEARFPIIKAIEEYLVSKSNLKPSSKKKYNLVIGLLSKYVNLKNITYLFKRTGCAVSNAKTQNQDPSLSLSQGT